MSILIPKIEKYLTEKMSATKGHKIAHSQRVSNWAIQIATAEKADTKLIQIAALLHDIGQIQKDENHGPFGAKTAQKFLENNSDLSTEDINEICLAIKNHNSIESTTHQLSLILRDADQLDMLGAVGTMRAFISKSHLDPYDPNNIKGKTWNKPKEYFNNLLDANQTFDNYIIDQINYQISRYDNLNTKTAKKIGRTLVEYQKNFIEQLEKEIENK